MSGTFMNSSGVVVSKFSVVTTTVPEHYFVPERCFQCFFLLTSSFEPAEREASFVSTSRVLFYVSTGGFGLRCPRWQSEGTKFSEEGPVLSKGSDSQPDAFPFVSALPFIK